MDSEQLVSATRSVAGLAAAGLVATLCLAGCGESASHEHQLAASRVYEPVGRPIQWNASPAERHGLSRRDFAGASMDGASTTAGVPPREVQDDAALQWTVPPGWSEAPPAPFRDVNFLVPGDARAECYLTTLSGEAGGMDANINRWRSQVSLPPLGPAEIAALPRLTWLDAEAIYVDFQGTWTGMAGEQAEENWRLVGLLQVGAGQSRFLKLVGPADVIGPQVAAFRELADSFHLDDSAAAVHAEPAASVVPAGTPPAAEQTASLSWRAPAGWTRGPEKPMRELTYFAGEGQQVECSVTLLDGDAGGLLANLNRWCGQMGAPALTEADLTRLERLPMAGAEGVLIRIERGQNATAPAEQELLLGAVCMLPGRSLFVKLTGPRDAVEAQAAALIAFCRTLTVLS